jgi:hypothetical protein
MKTLPVLMKALFCALVCLCVAGCAMSGQATKKVARFHDGSRANVVLQFSSWDYTFMVQPRYDEHGFLRPVRRDSLGQVLDGFKVQRDMAVVVIGWAYSPEDLGRLVAQWKTILGGCGFRRVVFLHSNVYNKLNGSLIIDDSTLSLAAAESPSPFRGATR